MDCVNKDFSVKVAWADLNSGCAGGWTDKVGIDRTQVLFV